MLTEKVAPSDHAEWGSSLQISCVFEIYSTAVSEAGHCDKSQIGLKHAIPFPLSLCWDYS